MDFHRLIKDGRSLLISHARTEDAAAICAYVDRISGESDCLTFGAGEFGVSAEDEVKFIADLDGGRFNFMLEGVVDGESLGFQREGVAARAPKIGGRYFSDIRMGICLD